MLKIAICISFCFLFSSCNNYRIETIKSFLPSDEDNGNYTWDDYKPYVTKKQIKEFEYGERRESKNMYIIYYVIVYAVENHKLVKTAEGYIMGGERSAGKVIEYYPDGKTKSVRHYILIDDSTGKVISIEDYNKMQAKIGNNFFEYRPERNEYNPEPDSIWTYYSEDGKLIREEIYDKGVWRKSINY